MEQDVAQHTQMPIAEREEREESDVEGLTEPIEYARWEELVAEGRIPGPTTLEDYFNLPEQDQRQELLYGWRVSESQPIPRHQLAVANLIVLIGMHLMETGLGQIMPSSDILFDEVTRLVLAPDAVVLLHDRMHLIAEKRLDGPPNLVIETLSPSTSRRDRVHKLEWYHEYGVDEYWIVDSRRKYVEVVDFISSEEPVVSRFVNTGEIRSQVLPELKITAGMLFAPLYQAAIARIGLVKPGESSTSYAKSKRKRRYDTDPA
jgi:Uma2 family endonuclease